MIDRPEVPELTVVIPTLRGTGPVLATTLAALVPQLAAVHAEVLVVDGSGQRPPAPLDGVAWRSSAARTVDRLRAEGLAAARGRLVAVTEDHCRVAPDWCAAIVRAHAEHPDALAIGGAVANDSRDSALDWASFYAEHAPELAPLPRGPRPRLAAINVSYKAPVARAEAPGAAAAVDDRIRVWHRQSYGSRGTTLMHLHSGRAHAPRRGVAGALRALAIPLPRTLRRLATAWRRGEPPRRLLASAPWMLWLLSAQALGETLGAIAGPGDSARRVR